MILSKMKRALAALTLVVLLTPSAAFAQTAPTETRDALINQLIALLTLQVQLLQEQLAQMQVMNERMADEPQTGSETPDAPEEPSFEIREQGSKFKIFSNVQGNPSKITVTLHGEERPSSLTLWGNTTVKGTEFTDSMKKDGNSYTIDLLDRLEGQKYRFGGVFEVMFPEEMASSTDAYTVKYEDESGETAEARLNKHALEYAE